MGVTAVINQSDDLSHIGLAIVHVMRAPEYVGASVRLALDSMGLSASAQPRDVVLSKREFEVVRLSVSGMTITEIAAQLRRSIKTISTQKISPCASWGLNGILNYFNMPGVTGY